MYEVNFKMDAGPERDPVDITEYLFDAGVAGGAVNNVFKIFFNYLHVCAMYTIEQGVTIVYLASDNCMGHGYSSISV